MKTEALAETAPVTRADSDSCDACGGSGEVNTWEPGIPAVCFGSWRLKRCPVCQGAGAEIPLDSNLAQA